LHSAPRVSQWLKYVPYQNLLVALGICGWTLWVGVHVVDGHAIAPREECRIRLEDWFQGQLNAKALSTSVGLKESGLHPRASQVCTGTWTFNCLPRRTQVFFAIAPRGTYARSWTELGGSDVGVLAEQFSIGPVDAEPYFRPDEPGTAVCVAQLDDDPALDAWSISTEARMREEMPVRPGELLHENDDTPPHVVDEIVW
jgi:hypothetical protein